MFIFGTRIPSINIYEKVPTRKITTMKTKMSCPEFVLLNFIEID